MTTTRRGARTRLRRRLAGGLAGVVLFTRNIAGPEQVARLTAALRAENPDALVGTDEETGEVTRLEVATGSSRPGGYALGVVDDVTLTEELARDLGRDLALASGPHALLRHRRLARVGPVQVPVPAD